MNFLTRNALFSPIFAIYPAIRLLALSSLLLITMTACSAVQNVGDTAPKGRSFLELLVEPNTAEIFVDEEYAGVVAGWHEQIVLVAPGTRKIELRAAGYITQRFDLDFSVDEQVTLELKMQRELPSLDDDVDE